MEKNIEVNWADTLTGEMLLFRLVGKAFYAPADRAWLASLVSEDVFVESPFGENQADVKAGLALLQTWSRANRGGIPDTIFDELQSDYTRLFIGPGTVIAPPWESVHCSQDRLLFQQQTLQVREWYRRFGLEAVKLYQEPDDHIGLELVFVAHLAELGLKALETQNQKSFDEHLQAQRGFLLEHLLRWGLAWCELVNTNARTDFYHGLALLTRGALMEIARLLQLQIPAQGVV